VQGVLIGARFPRELSEAIASIKLPAGEYLPFIDVSAEGCYREGDAVRFLGFEIDRCGMK